MIRITLGARRSGVTLAELLVVIVILGLIAGIAIQGFASAPHAGDPQAGAVLERQLLSARSTALRTRQSVVIRIVDSAGAMSATALPDGSIIGDATLSRDRLTGKRRDSAAAQE
jgi:prepilin-type N-terminal cleavage/methylation domain-containing protein